LTGARLPPSREIAYSIVLFPPLRRIVVPKPNYAFAKRQRDLAKKQKKEEKRLRKLGTAPPPPVEGAPPTPQSDKATE